MEPFPRQKQEWRQIMKARAEQFTPEDREAWDEEIFHRFFQLDRVQRAKWIMIYFSVRCETDTHSIIRELLGAEINVCLPVCTKGNTLLVRQIFAITELVPAGFGLSEPAPSSPLIDPHALELVVVPGVAFDLCGRRLGHGAGYYDRFLAGIPEVHTLGLAYDWQIAPELPSDHFDIPIRTLVTPSGVWEL